MRAVGQAVRRDQPPPDLSGEVLQDLRAVEELDRAGRAVGVTFAVSLTVAPW